MSRNFYKASDIAPPLYHGRGLHDIFGGGDAPPAPDYTPMKEASDRAAELGKELGDAQLAEGRRQYDQNMAVARPIVEAQTRTMNQTADQGQDYYNYGRSFRPAEQAMLASSFGINPEAVTRVQGMRKSAEDTARAAYEAKKGAADRVAAAQRRAPTTTTAAETRTAAPAAGGLIPFEGKAYTPNEFAGMMESIGGGNIAGIDAIREKNPWAPAQSQHLGIDRLLAMDKAAQEAGYTYKYQKGMLASQPTATSKSAGTTSEVQRSDGYPAAVSVSPVSPDYSEADAFQTRTLMEAAAAKRAREQGVLDDQSRLDDADRAAIDAYMSGQEIADAGTRARIQALIEAGDSVIYDQNTGEIETGVGRAVADARTGYSGAINQAMRQGLRYGFSPSRLAAMTGSGAISHASQVAAAANAARRSGISDTRSRLVTGATTGRGMQKEDSAYGLTRLTGKQSGRQTDFTRARNFGLQDEATDWGRKMDVVGMARGMPGASTGAYSVATNAGNSAVHNQMVPGQAYMGAINAGTGTIMQGQGMNVQGATNLAGLQTNAYNTAQQSAASNSAGFGQLLGTAAGIGLKKWIG